MRGSNIKRGCQWINRVACRRQRTPWIVGEAVFSKFVRAHSAQAEGPIMADCVRKNRQMNHPMIVQILRHFSLVFHSFVVIFAVQKNEQAIFLADQ